MTDACPDHMVLKSNVQISGRNASTWATRFSGAQRVEPAAAILGSSSDGMKRPPSPVVRFTIISVFSARMRSINSEYRSRRMDPLAVSGSRTCRWTIAAPAAAASSAWRAICSGVIGRCGLISGVIRLPVIAAVRIVLRAILLPQYIDDRCRQSFNNQINFSGTRRIRRCEQHVIAEGPVDAPL